MILARVSKKQHDPEPRKQAGTASAKALVDAVVEAAGALLVEVGLELTTNDVARRAGVSVGSLYQYFPNKEAILAEATRRVNDSFLAQLEAIVDGPEEPTAKLDAVIDLACSDRFGNLDLRRALFVNVPRSWTYTTIAAAEPEVLALLDRLVELLVASRTEQGLSIEPDARSRISVAFFMVRGAVQGALLYDHAMLRENRLANMLRPHVHAMLFGGAGVG